MIAIPGALMICTETWLFEVLAFLAGAYGPLPQSVYGLSFQIVMVPLIVIGGFVVAVATRVSNCLGAGDEKGARNAAYTCFVVGTLCAVVYAIICGSLRNYMGAIFTKDSHIISGLSETIPIIIVIMLLSVGGQVIAAVLHGAGKQWEGSLANVIGYDAVALPLCFIFAKFWRSRPTAWALWFGVMIGVIFVCVAMVIIFFRMDWSQEVDNAHKRVLEHEIAGDEEQPIKGEPETSSNSKSSDPPPVV